MSKSRYELTVEGLERFTNELDHLKLVKRKQNIEALQEARSQGDLSENAEYDAARDEQAQIEARINELENILRNHVLIEEDETESITIGKVVHFRELPNGEVEQYHIVGSEEADPFNGKISINSPIAQSLIGNEVGDTVTVTTPNGTYKVEIVKVTTRNKN